jgi:2-octaprenyl-6-methoxyphenol hydroxylase
MASRQTAEVAVIGAGPAGLAAAIALAASGVEVVVAAPPYDAARSAEDRRTAALLRSSIAFLTRLGVWRRCADMSAPLAAVRLIDDRGGLIRAPEVLLRASELGLADFGANVPNPALLAALNEVADRSPRLERVCTSAVTKVEPALAGVRLALAEGGFVAARLAVAADGRNSLARAAAGIAVTAWEYPQTALVTSFGHSRPHENISTEFHRRAGPLTTVPLPGHRSSLVWVETPAEARRLCALGDEAFLATLEVRLQGLLGSLAEIGPRALFPLSGLNALRMGAQRVALVGEAAHALAPIGAQGLNLGLKDAAALAQCVSAARADGRDIGAEETLAAYHAARSADVLARSMSVDLLNRSLLTDFLPVQALRGIGLHLIAAFGPLRRLVMRAGLGSPL